MLIYIGQARQRAGGIRIYIQVGRARSPPAPDLACMHQAGVSSSGHQYTCPRPATRMCRIGTLATHARAN